MKQAAKVKFSTLVPVVLAMFIFIFSPAAEASKFYEAKPENVPDWAKPGTFQFIRIDGGLIEAMKAERTHWGREFSEEEKDVLTNIYTKYQDTLFEKLKEAGFNWIWVTWSCGWSFKEENENRKQLRALIKRAHEEGIKVTTYLSASNMFWESTFRDESESVTWLLIKNGKPQNYGGPMNPMRFIADARNEDWREYMLNKAKLAINAGADAVFFDNIIGDHDALRYMFSQYQAMASRIAKKKNKPKVPLYVNAHLDIEKLDIHDSSEIIWNEFGTTTPGVWPVGWDVSNVRKTRFIMGAKHDWQPHKFEDDKYYCGPREKCFPDPVGQKLSIAEAWAFGSSFSRNIEGKFLKSVILGEPEGTAAWQAIAQYNNWINANNDFYTEVEPVAKIAVLSTHDGRGYKGMPDHAMSETLIKENVMFGNKVMTRFDRGAPFSSYKVLIIPDVLKKLDDGEKAMIQQFASSGGKVFAKHPDETDEKYGDTSLYGSLEYTPLPEDVLEGITENTVSAEFIDGIQTAAGGAVLKVDNEDYIVANVMKKRAAPVFFVHLINYEHSTPEQDIRVTLDLSDYIKDISGYAVRLYSPDGAAGEPVALEKSGARVSFGVDRVLHYTIAAVVPEAMMKNYNFGADQ
ncbi:MAG TPA: hypothetical protein PLN69_01760 [bacterium]|nr:hypothetical protein [bacterium]